MSVLNRMRKMSKRGESNGGSSVVWKEFNHQLKAKSCQIPGEVPYALNYLTSEIRKHLTVKGLFRLTIEKSNLDKAEEIFKERGRLPQETPVEVYCEVLKRWIIDRERCESFITKQAQITLAKIITSSDDLDSMFTRAVKCLNSQPNHHLQMNLHLFTFLHEVSQHADENKMTTTNLAHIFQVTLMEHLIMKLNQTPHGLAYSTRVHKLVNQLINKPSWLEGAPLCQLWEPKHNVSLKLSVQKKWSLAAKMVIENISDSLSGLDWSSQTTLRGRENIVGVAYHQREFDKN